MIKFLLANNSCFQPAFKINEQLGVCVGGGGIQVIYVNMVNI